MDIEGPSCARKAPGCRSLPARWSAVPLCVLLALVMITGCGALGKYSVHDRELRRAVLDDQTYTVEEAPRDAPAHRAASFRLAAEGYRAIQRGDLGEGEDKLETALSQDPRNPFCYLYLAEIRFREGDARQALILLSQAEVLFSGHPYWLGEVYTRRGRCWESLDSPDKARTAYSKALEYNPWNEESRERLEGMGASGG